MVSHHGYLYFSLEYMVLLMRFSFFFPWNTKSAFQLFSFPFFHLPDMLLQYHLIGLQVRRLAMEIRQLASAHPITVFNGDSGRNGNFA